MCWHSVWAAELLWCDWLTAGRNKRWEQILMAQADWKGHSLRVSSQCGGWHFTTCTGKLFKALWVLTPLQVNDGGWNSRLLGQRPAGRHMLSFTIIFDPSQCLTGWKTGSQQRESESNKNHFQATAFRAIITQELIFAGIRLMSVSEILGRKFYFSSLQAGKKTQVVIFNDLLEGLGQEEALLHVIVGRAGRVHVLHSWETSTHTAVFINGLRRTRMVGEKKNNFKKLWEEE